MTLPCICTCIKFRHFAIEMSVMTLEQMTKPFICTCIKFQYLAIAILVMSDDTGTQISQSQHLFEICYVQKPVLILERFK